MLSAETDLQTVVVLLAGSHFQLKSKIASDVQQGQQR